MAKTFLVTGAAGFIGSHSVEWLLARGWRVVGVDNLRTGHLENLAGPRSSPGFEWVLADASDESVMHALFEQHHFAGVLHLAALVSVPESFREPALNYRLNLATADSVARLCIEIVSGWCLPPPRRCMVRPEPCPIRSRPSRSPSRPTPPPNWPPR
jgi:UDP-glucose 4-epimerase